MTEALTVGSAASIAVLDVGKTNVKLSATTPDGAIAETLSARNVVAAGPPWRHHDLKGMGEWVFEALAALARRHPLRKLVATGHGSAGVLVGSDTDEGTGAVLPMIDYEQDLPLAIQDGYRPLAGSFFDRGSAIMLKAAHQARQMYWMQQAEPKAFRSAKWFLGLPQYWAWRLSGVAASETTMMSAQSHLWNVVDKRWSPIVSGQGWQPLMPSFRGAWETLGPIRKDLVTRYGLPRQMVVLTGGHDSSLNLYRYQTAGMPDACVISTGTWIVGMCVATPLDRVNEARGMVLNSDVTGRPVGGALTMGGREFSHVAGEPADAANADASLASRLIDRGSFAAPSFGDDDGLFPGSAGQGFFAGPPPQTPAERKALAVLYTALLTVECIDALTDGGLVILDGTFLRDPLYASLVAALRPGAETLFSLDAYGIASGAALLAGHTARLAPASIALSKPAAFAGNPDALASYARQWRALASQTNSQPSASRRIER